MSSHDTHHSFSVEGMTCASCSRIVERTLNKLEGTDFVSVNLATHRAYVVSDSTVTEDKIEDAIRKSGYTYMKEAPAGYILQEQFDASRRGVFQALFATVPLMVLMILHMSGIHIPGFFVIETLLAGFVLFGPGRKTIRSALVALRHGHTNMDTLVTVSSFVAWFTAILGSLGIQQISFGSIAAMILTFHLGGR